MSKGRFTIPTDESFVEGTKIIAEKWGADAVRDCDGTKLPENPGQFGKFITLISSCAAITNRRDNTPKKHREFSCFQTVILPRMKRLKSR